MESRVSADKLMTIQDKLAHTLDSPYQQTTRKKQGTIASRHEKGPLFNSRSGQPPFISGPAQGRVPGRLLEQMPDSRLDAPGL